LAADAQLPNGPVLMVSSTVRTRWAATVAASLLREQDAPQVLLQALHLQPRGMIGSHFRAMTR
jgi:ATP-dependent DNA helicase RecQ